MFEDNDIQEHERQAVNEKPDALSTETPWPLLPMNNAYEGQDVVPPEVGQRYQPIVVTDDQRLQYDSMSISASISDADAKQVLQDTISAYVNAYLSERRLADVKKQIAAMSLSKAMIDELTTRMADVQTGLAQSHDDAFKALVAYEQAAGFSGLFLNVIQNLKTYDYVHGGPLTFKDTAGKLSFTITPQQLSASATIGAQVDGVGVAVIDDIIIIGVIVAIIAVVMAPAAYQWASAQKAKAKAQVQYQESQAAKLGLIDKVRQDLVDKKLTEQQAKDMLAGVQKVEIKEPGSGGSFPWTPVLIGAGALLVLGGLAYMGRGKIKSMAKGTMERAFA